LGSFSPLDEKPVFPLVFPPFPEFFSLCPLLPLGLAEKRKAPLPDLPSQHDYYSVLFLAFGLEDNSSRHVESPFAFCGLLDVFFRDFVRMFPCSPYPPLYPKTIILISFFPPMRLLHGSAPIPLEFFPRCYSVSKPLSQTLLGFRSRLTRASSLSHDGIPSSSLFPAPGIYRSVPFLLFPQFPGAPMKLTICYIGLLHILLSENLF